MSSSLMRAHRRESSVGRLYRLPGALRGSLSGFSKDTDGAVAVIAALALPVLIGIAGLSLEYGQGLLTRVENQRVADLAAYAGASAYSKASGEEVDKEEAGRIAAENVALLNGIDDSQITVVFAEGPEGGMRVQADILETRDLVLTRVLSDIPALDIATRAIAGFGGTVSGACILGLNYAEVDDLDSITISGNIKLDMPDCAIASSGNMNLNGGVDVNSECISPTEPKQSDACTFGWRKGGPFNDPYSSLIDWSGIPSVCTHGPGRLTDTSGNPADEKGGVLAAGVHCINSSVDITGNTSLTAEGPVTLLFKPGFDLKLGGTVDVKIAAPATGATKGLLIHAPDSSVTIAGTVGLEAVGCEGIIAREIKFTGNATVNAACTKEDREELSERLGRVRLFE